MTDTTHDGWTNYETWAVHLWMTNEASSADYWFVEADDAYESAQAKDGMSRVENAAFDLAQRMQSEFEDGNPLADAGNVYTDLLNAALSEVNWYEIAQSFLESYNPA